MHHNIMDYVFDGQNFHKPIICLVLSIFATFFAGRLIGPSKIGNINGFLFILSFPFTLFYILVLSIPLWPLTKGGAIVLGFLYAFVAIGFWPVAFVAALHVGWVLGTCKKEMAAIKTSASNMRDLPAVENGFDSNGVETIGELQKQIEEARDKVAHLRRFAERPSATLNDINAHEAARRRLMALELKIRKSDS